MKLYVNALNSKFLGSLVLFFLSFYFTSCSQQDKDGGEQVIELKSPNEEFTLGSLVFERDINKETLTVNSEEITKYLKTKKIKYTNVDLNKVEEYVYLFYLEIKEDGRIVNTAETIYYGLSSEKELYSELQERSIEDDGIIHRCDGSCNQSNRLYHCEVCSFIRVKGKIIGCKCNLPTGKCCHSIEAVEE